MAHGKQRCNGQGEAAIVTQPRNAFPFFLVAAALFGLAVVPIFVLTTDLTQPNIAVRRPIIGALFGALCIAGIAAAIYPVKCKRIFGEPQNPVLPNNRAILIVGHHPDCEKYGSNRIEFAGRQVCAACAGLLVGGIVALGAAVFYFFLTAPPGSGSLLLLLLCEGFMLVGLMQIYFKRYVKALVNLFFVVGSSVALIQVDVLGRNLWVDLYMLGLIAFILWLRITLSEWHNRRICQKCRRCF